MSIDQAALHSALTATLARQMAALDAPVPELRQLSVQGADVAFEVKLGFPAASLMPALRNELIAAARSVPGVGNVSASVGCQVTAHAVQRGVPLLAGVRNIVAVASGKGGVGKSTTAANLALALTAEGARVGLLDADIYGPSQPTMLGLAGQPESLDGKMMEPLRAHGVQVMSIGFMVGPDDAMIWRGPMAVQALDQLLHQTRWDDLDYLLVDMPPGTGDFQLSLAQRVPVTGAVIVTTPQDIALLDARKGIRMFEKVSVPILGLVENMAVHVCTQCGHVEHIFGADGGRRMADELGVPFLGSLPLALRIREQADRGTPMVAAAPDSAEAELYRSLARRVAIGIARQGKDYSSRFPTISISRDT